MTENESSAAQADRESLALKKMPCIGGLTAGELSEIIVEAMRKALPAIKIYVLESDITAAQDAVRTVVEHSKF